MTDMITIRRAIARDASRLREIAVEAGIDAWTVGDYEEEIHRQDSIVLAARQSDRTVGFLLARIVPGSVESSDADLYNIAVESGSRCSGVGKQLLSELISRLTEKDVRNVWLEVRESNVSAIRFYESQGFTSEITRPKFYSNPTENAVIMRLRLSRRMT